MTRPSCARPSHCESRRERAFTLFEVVAAITIMAIGVTAVLASFNGMNETHRLMERRTEAALHARSVMTLVRTGALTPKTEEKEGTFEGADYRFSVSFAETEWTNLYAVGVQIAWGADEGAGKINLYTLQYYE
ncbi:MAG: prepilin-type N-terminal cleavage/methylation domain-containing protein [Candidatus Omnitrophica bacterium]|nr:hypothetical protein [bacterium]NUN94991.1 prepilin-type N-terminal cleavage/methylation domain-containing protein [Candidatus Omnitrophota bacterium]